MVPEEDGITDTFVAWRDFAINICFRDATTTAPRVADFATDVTPRADVDRRGEHKPHFVYMMHNVFSSAQDAHGSGLAVQLGTWRGARTNRGVVPRSLAVMDYRTEIHLLNARGAGVAMPPGDILGAGGETPRGRSPARSEATNWECVGSASYEAPMRSEATSFAIYH